MLKIEAWSFRCEAVALGRSKRLSSDCLPKTQVRANPKRGCIRADAWPVSEGESRLRKRMV